MRTITIFDLTQISSRLDVIKDIVAISSDINCTITLKLRTKVLDYEVGTIKINQDLSVSVTELLENYQTDIQQIVDEYFK